jgi:hypothetical protein
LEAKELLRDSTLSHSVCVLAFGNLGESAITSLSTIYRQLENVRFCICSDEAGKKWILSNTPNEKLGSLCFHDPEGFALKRLGLDASVNKEYSEFGKERFIKLTTFKWYLIREVLSIHKEARGALFTDLDVIWFKNPFMHDLEESSTRIFAQDDTPKDSKFIHLCSGIMYFPNTEYSIKLLGDLFSEQLDTNVDGNLIPDEPILNKWFMKIGQDLTQLSPLDQQKYIIGHRYFHFFLKRKALRQEVVCFHLNYVIGEYRKYRRAKALASRMEDGAAWIFYSAMDFVEVMLRRLLTR